jgi:amidohydrolase
VKAAAATVVDEIAADLLALSHDLHAHPETAFRETRSVGQIAKLAAARGLPVRIVIGGLDTAFVASAGSGPTVVILCEYDALPRLGHACGHNVIAAASLGAALALARVAREAGGCVRLVGTPAEEGLGGGKVLLARAGLFDGARAAMMVHPSSYDTATPNITAAAGLLLTAHGRAAHAAMYPERGVNALDAVVLGYSAMAALRAHLPRGARADGVIPHGGDAANVVPDRAVADVLVRHPNRAGLAGVRDRVVGCYRHGAAAVGATLTVEAVGVPYDDLRPAPALARAYAANARALGRRLVGPEGLPAGSTDVGNVSHLLPTIQPHMAIAPREVASHSAEFAVAAASPAADRAVLDGAKALAFTAIDVWTHGRK